jgi:hypothetical protein
MPFLHPLTSISTFGNGWWFMPCNPFKAIPDWFWARSPRSLKRIPGGFGCETKKWGSGFFWCFLIGNTSNTMVLGDKSYGIARFVLLYLFSGHERLTASIHHWIGTAIRSGGDGCAQPLGTPTDNWYITTITNYSIHH